MFEVYKPYNTNDVGPTISLVPAFLTKRGLLIKLSKKCAGMINARSKSSELKIRSECQSLSSSLIRAGQVFHLFTSYHPKKTEMPANQGMQRSRECVFNLARMY